MHDAGQPATQLLLLTWMLLPGCGAVWRPRYVSGVLGGNLSVTCTYDQGDEMKPKFWCRPGFVKTCDTDLVITKKDEPTVQQGRFSIHDNRKQRRFRVIMENLTEDDEDFYYCGVRTASWQWDKVLEVKVLVFPSPSPPVQPPQPSAVTAPSRDHVPGAPTTRSPTTVEPGTDAPQGKPGSSFSSSAVFPVLAGLQVLALAAGTGAVLWVTLRRG